MFDEAAIEKDVTVFMYADKIAKEKGIDKTLHAKKEEVALFEAAKTKFWDIFLTLRELHDAFMLLASFAGNLPANNMTKKEFDTKFEEYKEAKSRAWSQISHYESKIQPHIGKTDLNDYKQVDYWKKEADTISSKIVKLHETYYNSDAKDSVELMEKLPVIIVEKTLECQLTLCELKNILSTAKQEHRKNKSSSQLYLYFLVVQEIVSKMEHFFDSSLEEINADIEDID